MDVAEHVKRRLQELAPRHGRVLVAVSGGSDSVALLLAAHEAGLDIAAAHLDHGLRGEESVEDARFVAALAARLGVGLATERLSAGAIARARGWNLEDAARRVRYQFLHRTAKTLGCDTIAVAHTVDDQAETLLLQALRGSALPAGMRARRGMVVRPLLDVGRGELRAYLEERGVAWRQDSSNTDVGRARAWLRHEVMPVLERRYAGAGGRLAATAEGLADVSDALSAMVDATLGAGDIDVKALARAPAAVQRHAVAMLLRRSGGKFTRSLVERARAVAAEAASGERRAPWRVSVGDGRWLVVAYGVMSVRSQGRPPLAAAIPVRDVAGLREASRKAGVSTAFTDAEAARLLEEGPLVLRHRRPGDRVRLPAGTKKLSDLLIDRKVPREERESLVLLARGNEVLWVEGVPLDRTMADDAGFMRMALRLASEAAEEGELPVGALVVCQDGTVLARGRNGTEASADPTSHAEIAALRRAAQAAKDWRLTGATLYVTLEPCPMCWGAVLQTRVARVVYGAGNPREGALGGVMDLRHGEWKRRPEVVPGVLEEEASALLRAFFAGRR